MSGSGFDLSTSTFSQDGRIFQIEYAEKALENSDTIVGVKCKDGIILASEKLQHSKLLVEDANRVIFNIDTNIGMLICGRLPDGRNVVTRARKECEGYRDNYGVPMTGQVLAERIGGYVHAHTLYSSYRPLGVAIIIASHDNGVDNLYMIEPSGKCYGYKACTIGKGRMITRTELEKGDFINKTCKEALPLVAKMICMSHKENREKRFEFEASWMTEETGRLHKIIAKDLRNQAETWAEEEIEKEAYGEDD